MTIVVRALLTTNEINATFPFADFVKFFNSLSPEKINLIFHYSGYRDFTIDLELKFEGSTAFESANLFREVLIRSEADLNINCMLPRDTHLAPIYDDWTCVEVKPDAACLQSNKEKEIAVILPLLNAASDILKQAHITGSEIIYSINLEQVERNHEARCRLVPALAEMEEKQLNDKDLLKSLNESVRLANSGGWSARERIWTRERTTIQDKPWIEALIRLHLHKLAGFLPDELLPLCWNSPTSHTPKFTLQTFIGQLRHHDYLDKLFKTIVPSNQKQHVFTSYLTQVKRIKQPPTRGNYAFISYTRLNLEFQRTFLKILDNARVRYWLDTSINPGLLWDEELENRILNCGILIACVSDEFQNNKYCTRELKFADLKNKVILPVAQTSWMWGPGLQMMFQELQIGTLNDDICYEKILTSLRSLAPQIFY